VPNLFNLEERGKIIEEVSQFMSSGTPTEKYQHFI
jgi:hypothetical protein